MGGWLQKLSIAINNALEAVFWRLATIIGKRPFMTVVITLLFAAACMSGLALFTRESRPHKVWVPQDSQVLRDREFADRNFPVKVSPAIFIGHRVPTNGDAGVLEASALRQLLVLHQQVLAINTTIDGTVSTWDSIALRSPGGRFRAVTLLALWEFDAFIIRALNTSDILLTLNDPDLMDPWNGGDFSIGDVLGGVHRGPDGQIISAEALKSSYYVLAQREFNSQTGDEMDSRLDDWSEQFEKVVRQHNWTQFSSVTVFTESGFDAEILAAISGDTILLASGYLLILLYVILNLGRYNRLEHKVWLSAAGIFSTGLAVGVSFGVCSVVGLSYGPLHAVLPFLLLGIGVDDMFVMVHSYLALDNEQMKLPVPERLGATMKIAGVAVAVTSVTDFAAFLVGTVTILPALRSFCVYAAVGIFFDFVFQITFFAAIMGWDAKRVDQRRDACLPCLQLPDSWKPPTIKGRWLTRYFKEIHTTALEKTPVKLLVILLTIAMAGGGLWATFVIDTSFQYHWFLPGGSYIRDYNAMSGEYFAESSTPFTVYLGEVDYSDASVQGQLRSVIMSVRTNPYVSKDVPVDTWIEGFASWPNATNMSAGEEFYESLRAYLASDGARFAASLRFDANSTIQASSFSASFVHLPHSRDEVVAMDSVRAAVESETFPGGVRASVYTRQFLGWITNKVINTELFRNLLGALGAVFVLALVLIANFVAAVYVMLCVILTLAITLLVMHMWNLTINTVTSVVILLSCGLAVDYSAHVAHYYMASQLPTQQGRANAAIANVGAAVFNGGLSTFLAFVPLAFSSSYVFTAFFRIFLSVVTFGLWNGLIFLPVLLSLVGPDPHKEVLQPAAKRVLVTTH